MGLDLRLLPCECWTVDDNGRVHGYAHTILNLGRIRQDAYSSFKTLVEPHVTKMPAGHNISSFVGELVADGHHKGEHVYGTFRADDAYGNPYEVVTALHLLPLTRRLFLIGTRRHRLLRIPKIMGACGYS